MRLDFNRFVLGTGGVTLAGIVTVLAVAFLHVLHVPVLDRIGLLVFDAYQRTAPRAYDKAPVRIVAIDEESLARLGQWPWPRDEIARLTDRLASAGAAAIAFDIVFSEPDRTSPVHVAEQLRLEGHGDLAARLLANASDHDMDLEKSFSHAPVVAGFFLLREKRGVSIVGKAGLAVAGTMPGPSVPHFIGSVAPLPRLAEASAGNGFLSLVGDSDSIVRRAPLLAFQDKQLLPSLALDAVRVAQGAGAIVVKTSDASGEIAGMGGRVMSIKVGDFEVPVDEGGALWMHYTRPHPQRIVPAWQVLKDGALSPAEMANAFAGQIVFIGASASGLRDLISTPLQDRELGVMVHAQAAEQMILGRYLVRPDWAEGLERGLLLIFGTITVLLLPRLGAAKGATLCLMLIGAMMAGSWLAFSTEHFLLDPSYPVLALILAYMVQTGLTFYREETRRAYIHTAFDRYLSPELVKRIAEDPGRLELGGEEREMTVLFCDIRGFSRISEGLDPKQIIDFLIAFLTPMCDILLASKATLDKFIGDAIVAFWNAPLDDADQFRNAARAALGMARQLTELNRVLPVSHWPGEVKIGIGLNSGLCCVGNMGSAQRLSYSLIGDAVNLASRIEGLTKYYGVEIALGSALAARLTDFALIELDTVRVVGRDRPETVHALLGDETRRKDDVFRQLQERHEAMLAAYYRQDWGMSLAALDRLENLAGEFGLIHLYEVYRSRIGQLRANPPGPEWDGVYQADAK